MAENCNVLRVDNMNCHQVSNPNDLLSVTADSENSNASNDASDTIPQLELHSDVKDNIADDALKNSEHHIDQNLNVSLADLSLTISEAFSRLKLNGNENDSFTNELENVLISEKKSSENDPDVTSRIAEGLPLQEASFRPTIILETLISPKVGCSQQLNASCPFPSGETLLCSEINNSPCHQDVNEIATAMGSISGQDVCNNNSFENALSSSKDKSLQDAPNNLSEISSSSIASTILQDIQSEHPVRDTSLNKEKTRTSLDQTQSHQVSNEASNSSLSTIAGFSLSPNNESAVDRCTLSFTDNQDVSFCNSLPVKSAEPMDFDPVAETKTTPFNEAFSPFLSVSGSRLNSDNERADRDGALPSKNQDLSFSTKPIDQSTANDGTVPSENRDLSSSLSLPAKSAEPIDGFDSLANAADSSEVSNSYSSIDGLKLSSGNESAVATSSEYQDLLLVNNLSENSAEPLENTDLSFDAKADSCSALNSSSSIGGSKFTPDSESTAIDTPIKNQDFGSLPIKSPEQMDCLDSVHASNKTDMNNTNSYKEVPELPQKYIEPKAMPSLDASEQELLEQAMSFHTLHEVSSEFQNTDSSSNTTKIIPCNNSENHVIADLPIESGTDDCCGIPDSVVFADLKDVSNPCNKDDLFKVPEVPQNEDEVFTDAVQFFKDPSSFQFLENIQTSGPPESVIARSSLYVAFDPLHSKINPGSRMQAIPFLPRRSLTGIVEGELTKNSSVPINKHFSDVSERESMGNILISFDSPMASARAQSSQGEDEAKASIVEKRYTEEELQQALKMHELSLQEMYLWQHRELEQEMAKIKRESKATIDKLSLLSKNQQFVIEELLRVASDTSKSKVDLQEKMDVVEKDNEKLKEDLKTAGDDLQGVETMFADFHKRYEQCKGMLKSYKDNEVLLKEGVEIWKTKLIEQEQKYNALQERSQDIVEKANDELASVQKSCDGQVTVLKAQLKKAELKISGLESDIRQIKTENNGLRGICDDLMARVSKS